MKKSDILKQERAAKVAELNALVAAAETEKRDLNENENAKFDTVTAAIAALDANIARAEALEAFNRNAAAEARAKGDAGADQTAEFNREEREAAKAFSMVNLIRTKLDGKEQTGAEAEMLQEGKKEARSRGLEVRGMALPNSAFVKPTEKRTVIVATSNDAIPTMPGEFIDALRPYTRILEAGAKFLPGLTGNVSMPRLTASVATWEGETDANADGGAAIDAVTLAPKRLSSKTFVSHQFLAQAPFMVEQELRNDLLRSIGEAVDKAAIQGASGGTGPTGIINMSGVNSVVIGATGGAITHAKVLEMLKKQIEANALRGEGMAWLTSGRTYTGMSAITKDSGSGRFLLEGGMMEGYKALFSNYVPTDLEKSTSGTVLSALIFGYFPNLVIGQFGVNDLIVDQYTKADDGQIKLVVNSFWDIKARQETAFTVVKDLTT